MLVLLTANYLPVLFSAVFFIACLIFTIIAAAVKPLRSQRLLLILVTSGLAFGCFFLYTRFNYLPALKLDGEKIPVSATVTDIGTSRSGKSVLTVRLDRSVVQTPIPVKANIYLDEPGDIRLPTVSAAVSFYLPFGRIRHFITCPKHKSRWHLSLWQRSHHRSYSHQN